MDELKKISIIWGLILLIIFSVLTFFGIKWKNKMKPYFDLESTLVEKTKSYYEQGHTYPTGDEIVKVTYAELKENNVYSDLKINDSECDGYVTVKSNGAIEYKGYIKCPDYTTKGYE